MGLLCVYVPTIQPSCRLILWHETHAVRSEIPQQQQSAEQKATHTRQFHTFAVDQGGGSLGTGRVKTSKPTLLCESTIIPSMKLWVQIILLCSKPINTPYHVPPSVILAFYCSNQHRHALPPSVTLTTPHPHVYSRSAQQACYSNYTPQNKSSLDVALCALSLASRL